LSLSAWPADAAAALQGRLGEVPGVSVHVIDVGVAEPADFTLDEIHLSGQVLSVGGNVDLATSISCLGTQGERTVELEMRTAEGKPQKRAEQPVALQPGEARPLEFHLGSLEQGTHQGLIRILGQDGLAEDDTRYFTVAVRPAWPVLVAARHPSRNMPST